MLATHQHDSGGTRDANNFMQSESKRNSAFLRSH